MKPRFFRNAQDLRRAFASKPDATELQVGFYKKGSGRRGVTYPEAVEEALCAGWIDGVTHGIDAERYTVRFTPRKARSPWSKINIKRARGLIEQGRMRAPGRAAFENRTRKPAGYSFESAPRQLRPADVKVFRAHPEAWEFFEGKAPSYRRVAAFWVTSAKQEATRARRLAVLIESSRKRELAPLFLVRSKKG